jgi:hypothetical protein
MVYFNWLHLTDLHLGMEGFDDHWPQAEDKFYADVDYLIDKAKAGPLDLILFTGDLTQNGTDGQFHKLDIFLAQWCGRLRDHGSAPQLLAVPGNHDLVRPDPQDPSLISLLHAWHEPDVNKPFWADALSPYRKLVDDAFANYSKWWDSTAIPKPDGYQRGPLPGEFAATVEKEGVSLGVLGLNSAFLQLKAGHFHNKLVLHVRQFNDPCKGNGIAWTGEHHACLLMTHHPPDWLTPQAQRALNGEIHEPPHRFALQLFGHMHEHDLTTVSKGGGEARRRLQGSSLFSMEEWDDEKGTGQVRRFHGYSLNQLKVDGKGKATLRFWPRKAERKQDGGWDFISGGGFSLAKGKESTTWEPITLLRPFQRTGHGNKASRKPALPLPASCGKAHHQILPVTDTAFFTGRETQLVQLGERLLREKGTTDQPLLAGIWGTPGAGKSALATVFAERHAEHFPDGVLTVDVRANVTPEAIAHRFASLFGDPVNPDNEGHLTPGEMMQGRFTMRRCLLILDNADEGTFREIYPHGRPALLLTSKDKRLLMRMGLRDTDLIHAGRLTPDEARGVLVKILGQENIVAEPSAVEDLLALLGHLAMGVRIAGSAIAEQIGSQPIARYLARLREQPSHLASALHLEGDEQLKLSRVFELSLDLLRRKGPTSGSARFDDPRSNYLRLSVCAPSGFGYHVAQAVMGLSPEEAEDSLTRFHNLAVLEYQAEMERFRFHPLLQSFACQKAKELGVYDPAAEAHRSFFSTYVRSRTTYTAENLAALVAEQDAIVVVARERVREKEVDLSFIQGLNALFEQTGQWEVAIDLAEKGLDVRSLKEGLKLYSSSNEANIV